MSLEAIIAAVLNLVLIVGAVSRVNGRLRALEVKTELLMKAVGLGDGDE